MKTRVLFLMLLSAVVVSLSSCTHTEKRLVPNQNGVAEEFMEYYLIDEVDGKRLWGLEGTIPSGSQRIRTILIPIQYDSIAVSDISNNERLGSYKALKDGLWYPYLDTRRLSTPGFLYCENIKNISQALGLEWKLYTPDGVYGMYSAFKDSYGPYEDLYPGAAGHFFQKNGKWGYIAYDRDKDETTELLPAEYESIIEVSCRTHLHYDANYFLVQKDGKWSFFNRKKVYPQPSWYSGLLFDSEHPLNHSLNSLVNWYKRFPAGNNVLKISYKLVACSKHPSGAVGVIQDH